MKKFMYLCFTVALSFLMLTNVTLADFESELEDKVEACGFTDYEFYNQELGYYVVPTTDGELEFEALVNRNEYSWNDEKGVIINISLYDKFFPGDLFSTVEKEEFLREFNIVLEEFGLKGSFFGDKLLVSLSVFVELDEYPDERFCTVNAFVADFIQLYESETDEYVPTSGGKSFGIASGKDKKTDKYLYGAKSTIDKLNLKKPEINLDDILKKK
jgi:hypothetical protein